MSNNVYMKQISQYQWEIVSQTNHVIQTSISFSSIYKAEEYVKNYISSFIDWEYTMVTLDKEKNQGNKGETQNANPIDKND